MANRYKWMCISMNKVSFTLLCVRWILKSCKPSYSTFQPIRVRLRLFSQSGARPKPVRIYLRTFSRAWHSWHVLSRFPALGTRGMFSLACHQLQVFPRLPLVTSFPALVTGYMFSRACHWWQVFPRLSLVTCFPALATGYMFSRACHWLQVFPRLSLVTSFPALVTGYMFSRACHWLHVFPRLSLVTSFPALSTGYCEISFVCCAWYCLSDDVISLFVCVVFLLFCFVAQHGFKSVPFLCRAINNWYQVVKTSSLSKQQRRQLQKDVQDRFQVRKQRCYKPSFVQLALRPFLIVLIRTDRKARWVKLNSNPLQYHNLLIDREDKSRFIFVPL